MAKLTAGKGEPLSRYEQLQVWRERRRAALDKSLEMQGTVRSAMVNHINDSARAQVQISEQMLRNKGRVNKRV